MSWRTPDPPYPVAHAQPPRSSEIRVSHVAGAANRIYIPTAALPSPERAGWILDFAKVLPAMIPHQWRRVAITKMAPRSTTWHFEAYAMRYQMGTDVL